MEKKDKVPIVCVVGPSGSGKTVLIERLVRGLKSRGYRVATIKHASHGFDLDREGKDSWRHRQAGADSVVLTTKGMFAFLSWEEPCLEELAGRFLGDVDIVLAEGYKATDMPKIEIVKGGEGPLSSKENLIAVVGDRPIPATKKPLFSMEDAEKLVELLEQRFLRKGRPQG